MYLCILDAEAQVLVHKNLRSSPEEFLETVAPCREGLVVAVECIFTWYWLADLCARKGIAFFPGHALMMKAIRSGKAKIDRIDALNIATLLRGKMRPHIQMASQQYNLPPLGRRIAYPANRDGVATHFEDPPVRKSIGLDPALLERYDEPIHDLELDLVRRAKESGGKKLGEGKALRILAHKLGRAAYWMLARGKVSDAKRLSIATS
jgi:hypothetical protein